MLAAIRPSRLTRRLALALFACALAMRVLVPAGWMPEAHAGTLTLAICAGTDVPEDERAVAKALFESGLKTGHGKDKPAKPCDYAVAAQAAVAPDHAAVEPAIFPAFVAPQPALRTAPAPGRGLAAPPPPPTGPPALA